MLLIQPHERKPRMRTFKWEIYELLVGKNGLIKMRIRFFFSLISIKMQAMEKEHISISFDFQTS